MSREFPDFVDPWRLAAGKKAVGGTIPLARFRRLGSLLHSAEGDASFNIRFGFDEQRRAKATVDVEAPLMLLCQRSLKPYKENVRQKSHLLIIAEQGEQANLSDQEEFVLVEEGRLAIADLVEDELLLAVPQVPRNPEMEVVRASTSGDPDRDDQDESEDSSESRYRPFEVLAKLMKDQ